MDCYICYKKCKDGRILQKEGTDLFVAFCANCLKLLQPERSKREDSEECPHGFFRLNCAACNLKERIDAEMRCSEHDGNAVRTK